MKVILSFFAPARLECLCTFVLTVKKSPRVLDVAGRCCQVVRLVWSFISSSLESILFFTSLVAYVFESEVEMEICLKHIGWVDTMRAAFAEAQGGWSLLFCWPRETRSRLHGQRLYVEKTGKREESWEGGEERRGGKTKDGGLRAGD